MPRKKKYHVSLSREDRGKLEGLIACGHAPARQLTHARILLKADEGEDAPHEASWPDTNIADALEISRSTVARVRERFTWEGLEAALVHRRPKATKPKKLDGEQEAHLIALAMVSELACWVPICSAIISLLLRRWSEGTARFTQMAL